MAKSKQGRGEDSSLKTSKGIGQLLAAMVHIVTTAYINRDNKDNNLIPGRGDYLQVVSWFVGLSILTALATSLGSYAILLASQQLLETMTVATLPMLYQLIVLKMIAEVGSALINFGLDFYKNKSDNFITYKTRDFMSQFVRNLPEHKDDNSKYVVAQRDSLPSVVGHITAIINFTVFVVVYGAYALSHLNPSQLLIASITGAIAIVFNKGISCQFDQAQKKDIEANAETYTDMTFSLRNKKRIRQIGAWRYLKHRFQSGNKRIYESSARKKWYAGLLDLSANMVKSITENLFLIQFAILIAYGAISPIDVVILMPYIKKVSEAGGKFVLLGKLTTMVGRQITVLSEVWDGIMPQGLKVPNKAATSQPIKTHHIIIYATTLGIILPAVLPVFTSISVQALCFILLIWPMTVKVWPDLITSQLFMQIVATFEYPFTATTSVQSVVTKPYPAKSMPSLLKYSVDSKLSISFDCKDLATGSPIQVIAENNKGKTSTFVNQASRDIPDAMCIAEVEGNISFKDVLDQYDLKTTDDSQAVKQVAESLMPSINVDKPSNGGLELLNVLSAAYCARNRPDCDYICFDEALNSVALDVRAKVYQKLSELLNNKKVVYIDHAVSVDCRHATLQGNQFCLSK